MSELVRAEDIPNAVVLYGTIVNLSRLFGPALAGPLVVTLGYGWRFAIDAGALHRREGAFTVLYPIFSLGAVVGEPPLSRGRGRSGRPPGAWGARRRQGP